MTRPLLTASVPFDWNPEVEIATPDPPTLDPTPVAKRAGELAPVVVTEPPLSAMCPPDAAYAPGLFKPAVETAAFPETAMLDPAPLAFSPEELSPFRVIEPPMTSAIAWSPTTSTPTEDAPFATIVSFVRVLVLPVPV